jgi:predicted nicotinamide N-methyase
MTSADFADFVREHTVLTTVPFLPELKLHCASEAIPLWEKTEHASGQADLAPPFWAFPWAGGQGLARYVLDHPEIVAGKRVLDLASGSGLVALAAARCGAASVLANEVDPYADAAIMLNAAANGADVQRHLGDLLDTPVGPLDVDVVLAGDVFYSREMARRMLAFFTAAHDSGAAVLVGDPGRAYAPREEFDQLASYDVPVIRDLEDADTKRTTVLRLR